MWRPRQFEHPSLAFLAALTGIFTLLMWLIDTGVVKQHTPLASLISFFYAAALVVSVILTVVTFFMKAEDGWGVLLLNITGYFFHFPVLGTLLFAL